MKIIIRLLCIAVLLSLGYIGFQSRFWEQMPLPDNDLPVTSPQDQEQPSELDQLFTYLPFLGYRFEQVEDVTESTFPAVDGKRFVYKNNVLEVYQLDGSAKADELSANAKEAMRVQKQDGHTYLAVTLQHYLLLVIEANDPIALLDAYENASQMLEKLGITLD